MPLISTAGAAAYRAPRESIAPRGPWNLFMLAGGKSERVAFVHDCGEKVNY